MLLLASGSVCAQQVALTPGKPDCPPGEPDSLQISWTQPCDTGNWLFDTEAGCRMWDWHPDPHDKASWSGACSKGQKEGSISRAHSAADLSKSLLGILLGIRVLARVRPERKLLEGLVRPVFGLLDGTDAVSRRKASRAR